MFFILFYFATSLYAPTEEKSFVSWMRQTNQIYTGQEYHIRFGIFIANKRLVHEHNAKDSSFKLALNHLAALTPAEYRSLNSYYRSPIRPQSKQYQKKYQSIPESLDYRDTPNIVNPIRDQGNCGACYSFAVTFALEANWGLKFKEYYCLSDQYMIDCCHYCHGCDGGSTVMCYFWDMKFENGIWPLQENYPYIAAKGDCVIHTALCVCHVLGAMIACAEHDVKGLVEAVANIGPMAVAIDASSAQFQLYSSGIYDNPSCNNENPDHAVGLVGYGVENGTMYWIIRNSWGEAWGEQGYIRMIREGNDQCGVALEAVYPDI